MNDFVYQIEKAALQGDTLELKKIIHELIAIGACDEDRAIAILQSHAPVSEKLAA